MNILSLSCANAIHSHLIPLYVLHQRYLRRMSNVQNDFLLPAKYHEQYRNSGISVLDINFTTYQGPNLELPDVKAINNASSQQYKKYVALVEEAFRVSKPDIIIEDNELLSTLIADKNGRPRISIYRTGMFRSISANQRNSAHMHSMEKTSLGKGFDASVILKPEKALSKLYKKHLKSTYLKDDIDTLVNYIYPTVKLIPGIPSIERLPKQIADRDSIFFTGPLLVEDNPSEKLMSELEAFFEFNSGHKKVFVTTGLVDQDDIQDIIQHLLGCGYAVVTTRKFNINKCFEDLFFQNTFLSLNYICKKVDLIVHHCGSGMYHYPILHQKPSITIGTQCYDREDVALRLQELKLSKHVPSSRDEKNYMEIFKDALEAFEKNRLCDFEQLKKIKEEIEQTMLNFDMEKAINYASSSKNKNQ